MSSYVALRFDKTSPVLSINSPSYVSPTETVAISIDSNEHLLQYQSIYIIDSIGIRVDLTFTYQNDHYTGIIDFSRLNIGYATLYATLKDDVLNTSTVSKVIDIANISELSLSIREFVNSASVKESQQNIIKLIESANIATVQSHATNNLTFLETTMVLTLSEVERN